MSQFLVEEIYGHHKLESSCCDKVCLGENEELLPTAFLLSSKKQGIKEKTVDFLCLFTLVLLVLAIISITKMLIIMLFLFNILLLQNLLA